MFDQGPSGYNLKMLTCGWSFNVSLIVFIVSGEVVLW